METQGWPLYAARKDGGQVWAVVGWEYRSSTGGRQAIGVPVGVELTGGLARELGAGMVFTSDQTHARVIAGVDPRTHPDGGLEAAVQRARKAS